MRVLVVDVGGTSVKILSTGQKTVRKIPSGEKMTPKKIVSAVEPTIARPRAPSCGMRSRKSAGSIA